jgi:hypothetical protein
MPTMPRVAALLLVVTALVWTPAGAGEPLSEAAYATEVASWHVDWQPQQMGAHLRHERCVESWQRADAVRERMAAITPPASRAAYHAALGAFIAAYLESMDTCVGSTRMTPEWRRQRAVVNDRRRAIFKIVAANGLDLPTKW